MKQINLQKLQNKLRNKFLKLGVQMLGPETIYFSEDTKIGKKVVIEPYVVIGHKVKIGNNVKIKDFYFYDEQGTRLKILPEFLSSIFDGGVSEDEKNELVKMAIKQVEEISKKVAMDIQSDVDRTTKETINNLLLGFNKRIDSFNFYENNISQDQVNIENPGLLEEKLTTAED